MKIKLNPDKNPISASGLEVKIETSIVINLTDQDNDLVGRAKFNVFPGHNKLEIEESYKKLISLIENGEYVIENESIRFPGFYDIGAYAHGREYKIDIIRYIHD